MLHRLGQGRQSLAARSLLGVPKPRPEPAFCAVKERALQLHREGRIRRAALVRHPRVRRGVSVNAAPAEPFAVGRAHRLSGQGPSGSLAQEGRSASQISSTTYAAWSVHRHGPSLIRPWRPRAVRPSPSDARVTSRRRRRCAWRATRSPGTGVLEVSGRISQCQHPSRPCKHGT
jgi:hypothetical protein